MPRLQPGDYVKAEFKDEATGEGERMWVQVDSCDDEAGLQFGRLDNEPLLTATLHVGEELAVSYGKIVEHRRASEFQKQEEDRRRRHPQVCLGGDDYARLCPFSPGVGSFPRTAEKTPRVTSCINNGFGLRGFFHTLPGD